MKYLAILLPVAAWALSACDNIESNERWEEKVPVEIKKNVLIEDFTGQNCVNCPAATDVIHQLQQGAAGAHIIAVGIHRPDFHLHSPVSPREEVLLADLPNITTF